MSIVNQPLAVRIGKPKIDLKWLKRALWARLRTSFSEAVKMKDCVGKEESVVADK